MVPDLDIQDFQLAVEDRERVHQAFEKMLGEKTSQMMQFIFFHDLTQKEPAERMGVSEMVVSRAVHSSVKKLRDILQTEII